MTSNIKLEELAGRLGKMKDSAKDYIVDTRSLLAVPAEKHVQLQIGDVGQYALTPHCHNQVAEKCNIPKSYYDRMAEAGAFELLASNINQWIGTRDRRLVRTMNDGEQMARALLGDNYRILDNYDLLWTALEAFQGLNLTIASCNLTDTRLYMRAIAPIDDDRLRLDIKPGDTVVPGVIIRNSEVGNGLLAIEPFLRRLVCLNGMIGENRFAQVHIGRKNELGHLQEDTVKAQNQAIWLEVKDTITATFNQAYFEAWVDKIKGTAEIEVKAPMAAVDNVIQTYNLSKKKKDDLLAHFASGNQGAGNTAWGMINSLTALANEVEEADLEYDLQRAAGHMSTLEAKELRRLVLA
jgi:hypothetical protein